MRIASGKTDQVIYFVARDSATRARKTGLSSFTVYRSRNGAAAAAYTTPTIAEVSAANLPGVYAFTIDEDTSIAAGSDSEEMVLHVTATNMVPVTRTIELYRRGVTSGQTLDIIALAAAIAALPSSAANAAALLDGASGVETNLTVREALRLASAVLFGEASGMNTNTVTFRDIGDSKDRVTATVDKYGNRSALTRDPKLMFGARYYGPRYFGGRFFGGDAGELHIAATQLLRNVQLRVRSLVGGRMRALANVTVRLRQLDH